MKVVLILAILTMLLFPIATAQQTTDPAKDVKKWPEWECIRWTWTGDVYKRQVICLEWRKRDNRWIR